jgi:predicted ribosome quality control (RQC) complex YloA/Tae2 family protein
VSNQIRYDALLVRALAAELAQLLGGERVQRARLLKTERVLALELGERRSPRTLLWQLHPQDGRLALLPGAAPETGSLLQVRRGSPVTGVSALADERVLRIDLAPADAAAGIVRALVIELLGNRWNVAALADDDVIAAVLQQREENERALRAGVRYRPPVRTGRSADVPERTGWDLALRGTRGRERRHALLASFPYTSPLNADYILGRATEADDDLEEAYARYVGLLAAAPQPCVLPGGQPYPHPLGTGVAPLPTLLAAFAEAGSGSAFPLAGDLEAAGAAARARLHDREQRIRARLARLRDDSAAAGAEAAALRARADLLLAQLHAVPRGSALAELDDFQGGRVQLALDPSRSAQDNARAWYDEARRRDRVARRAPQLEARGARELERIATWRTRIDANEVSGAELERLARLPAGRERRSVSLPYRRYRTSGGLEVRVGRNARANDALTRAHAAPDDIWLHAREAGGAHVILRWARREDSPPARDLTEAAVLAALHSRARTSGTVPVDWTRRRYVRKPRKAPAGMVVAERVRTLFVEPDARLEERLRVEEEETPEA